MQQAVELFLSSVQSQQSLQSFAIETYWVGDSYVKRVVDELMKSGWCAQLHDPSSRLEFLSLPRESKAGIFLEKIPDDWDGARVQRLLASLFMGLRPGGILFLGYEKIEDMAILAWMRQAGFEALQQGFSSSRKATLARRIGAAVTPELETPSGRGTTH